MNQEIHQEKSLVSVLLPVSNSGQFLSFCLDSVLSQNYAPIEIIAIDDFSTDESYKILQAYKRKDNRIKVYKNVKKYGLAVTLNRLIKRAKGNYVVFMDARDTMTKNKLQKQLDFLIKNEKIVAVGTQCIYLNDEGKRIGKSSFPKSNEHIAQKPLHGVSVLFEGIMINQLKLPKDLLVFPTTKHVFLYSDMTLKLMQYGELANINEYLQFHRKHDYYSSLAKKGKRLFSLFKLWANSQIEHEVNPSFRTFFGGLLKPTS